MKVPVVLRDRRRSEERPGVAMSYGSAAIPRHHEHWDGAGYPEGRRGAESPIEARIVAVVDVYDALTHARVYKPAWPEEKVQALFHEQRGSQFDPDLVDTFFASLPTLRAIRESLPEEEKT